MRASVSRPASHCAGATVESSCGRGSGAQSAPSRRCLPPWRNRASGAPCAGCLALPSSTARRLAGSRPCCRPNQSARPAAHKSWYDQRL
eukprot:7382352-Prymnesium_polylepis.2